MLDPPSPSSDTEALRLAVELLIAGLALAGSEHDRMALYHDLLPLTERHPGLTAALRSLREERTAVERWRAYNRAEAAAAAWARPRSLPPSGSAEP